MESPVELDVVGLEGYEVSIGLDRRRISEFRWCKGFGFSVGFFEVGLSGLDRRYLRLCHFIL
jgi:hypothetical protein